MVYCLYYRKISVTNALSANSLRFSLIYLAICLFYNVYRARHGQPYYSLLQAIKQKVKSAVSYISDFEEELVKFARARKCDVRYEDMMMNEKPEERLCS